MWGSGSDLDAQEGHAQRADAQLLRRRTRMLHHALRRAALGTQRLVNAAESATSAGHGRTAASHWALSKGLAPSASRSQGPDEPAPGGQGSELPYGTRT